jgi:dipeptidase E
MMGALAAIGGGELKDLETLKIDRRIVGLTGSKNPHALSIPTNLHQPMRQGRSSGPRSC